MLPLASLMKRSPPSITCFSHHGALAYAAGSVTPRSCARAVNSLMNAVISGLKNTVGGTVVVSARDLKAVEPIQYSGIIMITISTNTSAMAPRFHQRDRPD